MTPGRIECATCREDVPPALVRNMNDAGECKGCQDRKADILIQNRMRSRMAFAGANGWGR